MSSTFSHWVLLVNKELLNQAAVSSHSLLLYLYIRWSYTKKVKVKSEGGSLSHVRLFATSWTIQSLEFSKPEYWSG